MKKLLFIAICFVSLKLSAQGNLQFNQVTSVTITGNLSAMSSITSNITVPAGKVWKIEHGSLIQLTNGQKQPMNATWLTLGIDEFWIQGNNNGTNMNSLPLWLTEGAHLLYISNPANAGPYNNVTGTLSIIEFNVVP